MDSFVLTADKLGKAFYFNKFIFADISLSLKNEQILGIAGKNGSGKSTLLKLLAGVLKPSAGKVSLRINDTEIKDDRFNEFITLVSPYLMLYDEFTIYEHLSLYSRLKGIEYDAKRASALVEYFHLGHKKSEIIKNLSSGMTQRVKYIHAFYHTGSILFLDEPFTNLDSEGIDQVKEKTREHISRGGAVIIASNDDREKALCDSILDINDIMSNK